MRNFDVHVCLVSKQPLPNLIPILVSDPKPKEVARLRLGLGRMVRTVKSYGGEVDDLSQQLTTFPAVWVTYGGSRVEAANTGKSRYREQAEMVVMVATRGLRSEEARRQGGADIREVGSNDLIRACRRLLDSHAPMLRAAFPDDFVALQSALRDFDFDTASARLEAACTQAGISPGA